MRYSLLPQKGTNWLLESANGSEEVEVFGNFTCDNGFGLKEMLLADAGIALVPKWLVYQELQRGDLIQVLPQFSIHYPIHAIFPKSHYMPLKVRAFIDFIKAALEKHSIFSAA